MNKLKLPQDALTMLLPFRVTADIKTMQQRYGADLEDRKHSEQRAIAQDYIETLRNEYEHSGNPLFVWRAYFEARAFGFDVPGWILSYFDAAAMEISRLYQAAAHGDKGSTDLRHILDALKFRRKGEMGRGSVFEKALKSDWIFYGATVQLYISQGDKPDFAIQSCAEQNNVSYSKVNRAWRKYRDRYGDKLS